MAKKKSNELISSLLYIIIGALLIIFRDQALGWAMTIAGVMFIVFGAVDLLRKNYPGGAISLIIGIAIIALGNTLVDIVLLVLGILIAIKGVFALIAVLGKKRKNALEIVFPILTVVVGILLAFGHGLTILIVITGVLLAIDGILGLIGSLKK